jgi:hypothetical protein
MSGSGYKPGYWDGVRTGENDGEGDDIATRLRNHYAHEDNVNETTHLLNEAMYELDRMSALLAAQPSGVTAPPEALQVTDAMVDAYLTEQRRTVEEADKFGRPNAGGLHTNTVREACRNGITAALAASPAPQAPEGEEVAWINYAVKMRGIEIVGYEEPELSFKQRAYGYDMRKARPLYTHPAKPAGGDAVRGALTEARPYVESETHRTHDGTNGHGIREKAKRLLAKIDTALAGVGTEGGQPS